MRGASQTSRRDQGSADPDCPGSDNVLNSDSDSNGKDLTCFEHLTPRVRRSVSKLKANVDLATQQVCKSYEETKYTQVRLET